MKPQNIFRYFLLRYNFIDKFYYPYHYSRRITISQFRILGKSKKCKKCTERENLKL